MGSHSVTFHPTQVNTFRLHPSQSGRYSIYLPRRDGRLSWPRLHTETKESLISSVIFADPMSDDSLFWQTNKSSRVWHHGWNISKRKTVKRVAGRYPWLVWGVCAWPQHVGTKPVGLTTDDSSYMWHQRALSPWIERRRRKQEKDKLNETKNENFCSVVTPATC